MPSASRAAAFDILLRVERQSAYASELLHSERYKKLSPPDHALCTELVMGVLRWRSALDASIEEIASQPLAKLDPEVLVALRLGAYQLGWLERVPARAAIYESVELVKKARKRSAAPFANAVLRKLAAKAAKPRPAPPASTTAPSLAAAYAHPEWLVKRWLAQYGVERAARICAYDQQVPLTAIRLRHAGAEEELRQAGIELAPGAFLARARRVLLGEITHTPAFREGRVAIQDEASQLVAALVGRGQRLLDCCAAPGGKTAILADRNPGSQVIAVELHPQRARLLRRLVRAENVQVICADAENLPVSGEFDRVLADVPCSGTGTLARNPESKWRLKPEDLADLHSRQVAIASSAVNRLAPGGRLVYSTCSLEREENQAVVEELLSKCAGLRLLDCRGELKLMQERGELVWQDVDSITDELFLRTLPGVHPCDGFFAAIFEKNG
ncbi:MAG TPA: 16S rRNA (cytosine(967)-C(5))-methyltransferase RsmB [Terriglobales bacterium]|nr:16S rRNA (cytosine(967)-C(5))-methyltransferase RsmB [Terriglobales bacterium]